jgi:hypothetical protein
MEPVYVLRYLTEQERKGRRAEGQKESAKIKDIVADALTDTARADERAIEVLLQHRRARVQDTRYKIQDTA